MDDFQAIAWDYVCGGPSGSSDDGSVVLYGYAVCLDAEFVQHLVEGCGRSQIQVACLSVDLKRQHSFTSLAASRTGGMFVAEADILQAPSPRVFLASTIRIKT